MYYYDTIWEIYPEEIVFTGFLRCLKCYLGFFVQASVIPLGWSKTNYLLVAGFFMGTYESEYKRKYFNTPTINLYDPMITRYRVWTINTLVMRSCGQTEKSQNGQKHDRTKAPKGKKQSGQNPQKRECFNTPTIKVYNPIITWYRCGQSTF